MTPSNTYEYFSLRSVLFIIFLRLLFLVRSINSAIAGPAGHTLTPLNTKYLCDSKYRYIVRVNGAVQITVVIPSWH